MKKLLGIVVLSLTFIFSNLSNAEGLNGLDGIKSFDLNVRGGEELCGVTNELIEDSIKYILSSSKIKLNDTSATILALEATIMHDPVGCFGRYGLDAYEWHSTQNSSGETVLGALVLWEYGSSSKSANDTFSRQFINSIENATKKFVVAWSEKNN